MRGQQRLYDPRVSPEYIPCRQPDLVFFIQQEEGEVWGKTTTLVTRIGSPDRSPPTSRGCRTECNQGAMDLRMWVDISKKNCTL